MDDDGVLAEQRAVNQARAAEYDEWWQRRGRFDRGPESAEEWDREVAQVAAALDTVGARGDVLELAGGTGWWTALWPALLGIGGHRLVTREPGTEPQAHRSPRCGLPRCRPDHMAAAEPEELQSLLGDLGWTARLDATRWFIFGEGVPC